MTIYLTPEEVYYLTLCVEWDLLRIRRVFGKRERLSLQEICRLKRVPAADRLWVVTQEMNRYRWVCPIEEMEERSHLRALYALALQEWLNKHPDGDPFSRGRRTEHFGPFSRHCSKYLKQFMDILGEEKDVCEGS